MTMGYFIMYMKTSTNALFGLLDRFLPAVDTRLQGLHGTVLCVGLEPPENGSSYCTQSTQRHYRNKVLGAP